MAPSCSKRLSGMTGSALTCPNARRPVPVTVPLGERRRMLPDADPYLCAPVCRADAGLNLLAVDR